MDTFIAAIIAFFGFLLIVALWIVGAIVSVSITVGIVWVVFKLFGIDIDGFTATLVP